MTNHILTCSTADELRRLLALGDMVYAITNLDPTPDQWNRLYALMGTPEPTTEDLETIEEDYAE